MDAGTDAVDRQTLRDLLDRTIPLTLVDLPEKGATPAARATLETAGGFLVDLPTLCADLAEACGSG